MKIDVENLNRRFPKYPITVDNKGWIYGVWYCGTSWQRVKLHGQYPPTFLDRALALFPEAKEILHVPSGTVCGPGVTVDLISDEVRHPQFVASADNLPFGNETFDLVLSDPPYSDKDAEIYQTGKFPLNGMMRECLRILRPGGYLGILHIYYPSYRRREWKLCALICVVTGFLRQTRIFSILQKRATNETTLSA
jgi:SAM-dependent methyltransferase